MQAFKTRKGRDSNPRRSFPRTDVPGLHLKPLGHLSINIIVFLTYYMSFLCPTKLFNKSRAFYYLTVKRDYKCSKLF